MKNQQATLYRNDSTAKRDLFLITLTAVACFIMAKTVNAFEWIYEATRPYEPWEFDFDELVIVGFLLSIAFAVFAYRRWRELAREIQERMRVQQELQQAYAQLQESIVQRQALEARRSSEEQASLQREAALTATLTERARVARELHDTLAQGLAGVAFQLEGVVTLFIEAPVAARQQLDLAIQMVRSSLEEARQAIWDMRPQMAATENLATVLKELGERLPTAARVCIDVDGCPKTLPTATEHHLLRIAHEALYNAARHAQATEIAVVLQFNDQDVRLYVRDNGRGFDVQRAPLPRHGHFGLLGMRERAAEIAGRLLVQSAPGEGTQVEVIVPLD